MSMGLDHCIHCAFRVLYYVIVCYILRELYTWYVTPRFRVRPEWRIRTEFGARDFILGLIDFFFLRAELVPVGIQTISVITKIIYIHKKTTTGVVSIKIYTHILSPIYIYKNCTFTFTYQSAGHTVMNPY